MGQHIMSKRKRAQVPLPANFGLWKRLLEQARLSWVLLLDGRVPIALKVIPLLAIAYVISPIDLVPDIFLVLGQLDDMGILLAAISAFVNMAPQDIVEEHTYRLRFGPRFRVRRDAQGMVIDVKAEPAAEDSTESETDAAADADEGSDRAGDDEPQELDDMYRPRKRGEASRR
jgi:uncharacterized membrane protein YkvA (DUF1232 family)